MLTWPWTHCHGVLTLLNIGHVFVIWSVSPLPYNLGSSYLVHTLIVVTCQLSMCHFRSTWHYLRFRVVRVARSLVFFVMFCRSLFVLLSFFSFVDCVDCSSSIYGFWLPFGIFKLFLDHRLFFFLFSLVHSVLLGFTTWDYPLVSSNCSFMVYWIS